MVQLGWGQEGYRVRGGKCVRIVDVCFFVRKQMESGINLYQRRISKYEVFPIWIFLL